MNTEDNIDIRFKDHYKLMISLKDKLFFESELYKNEIKYHVENEYFGDKIRFFFLDSDHKKVDNIIVKNEIVATVESNLVSDFNDQSKKVKLYLIIAFVFIAIIILTAQLINTFVT
ncbi:hypothetical protein [Mesoflavibacter sp. CH_XMU1422-2]|uniref:hypothetical protein n=1 Tax=Mesoflavibacter sp. CH_XMU1422-2 TaxID=3107770 RepID=UPI00300A8F7E